MTVRTCKKFALDLFFNINGHTQENLIFCKAPTLLECEFNILELPLDIKAKKSSLFCRAAVAMTRYLPLTEEFKLINYYREQFQFLGEKILPTMVRSDLMKRNPNKIGTNDFENLVVQNIKDEAILVACKNFKINQYGICHPSFPFYLDETEITEKN